MFHVFRYALLPVVLFCLIIVVASVDVYSTNFARSSSWGRTIGTVTQAREAGDVLAASSGKPNQFPYPQGTVTYVIDKQNFTWQGRGRDIGVDSMKVGEKLSLYYNPQKPQEISTLVLLGTRTGNMLLALALGFLGFYIWFFWLRRRAAR